MTLWPKLPFHHGETILSYADRVSMLHTGRGMERVVRDFGINTEHFISGREEAVARFATAVGLPMEDMKQASIRVFQRGASFRGEDISKAFLSPRAARYCPSCLVEDGHRGDRQFRLIWGFRHVSRCFRHSSWLIDAPRKNEVNLRLAIGTEMLGETKAAATEMPGYLQWLRTRLDGRPSADSHWLRDQTLEQVLAASEMLGATLEHGHRVAIKTSCPLNRLKKPPTSDFPYTVRGQRRSLKR